MVHHKNPLSGPAPLLLLLALVIGAAAWGLDHYLWQQAEQQATDQARTLARDLGGSLGGLVASDHQHLEQLAQAPRTTATLAAGTIVTGDWQNHRRLLLVPAGAPVDQALSFLLQDLLRRLKDEGDTARSSQGGKQPAVLLAHAAPGGALILEHRLATWLAEAARRMPAGGALTLEQDGLTVARRGQPRAGVPREQVRGGPFSVTVTVAPSAPLWADSLLPGGGALALGLLLAALVLTALRRRRPGPARATEATVEPARSPTPSKANRAAPSPTPASPKPDAARTNARRQTPPPPAPEPGPDLPADLFRADHLGGPALDAQALRHLGRAIGGEAGETGQHSLFLAGGSHAPEALFEALAEGLLASGRQVLDLSVTTRPVLYYAIEVLESQSGLYLDGDADDPHEIRLAVWLKGERLVGERLAGLGVRLSGGGGAAEAIAAEAAPTVSGGQREGRALGPRYLRALSDDIVLARPMKVVVAAGRGAATTLAGSLFEELGCTVIAPRNTPLAQAVTGNQADLGLTLSADGTRLAVVAADGTAVSPDRVMMVLARDLLSRHPGSDVLFDVECSRALATLVRKQGGRPVMARTDVAALKARLKETGAPLAGGMGGHICFADRWFGFEDGLYAAARLLEILSLHGGASAEVFADLDGAVATPELRIPLEGSRAAEFMEALLTRAERFPGGRPLTVDGLRVDFPDGWGLVRAARDAPALAMRFEGRDAQALERVQALFREQLLAVDADLTLPF